MIPHSATALSLALLLSLGACGADDAAEESAGPPTTAEQSGCTTSLQVTFPDGEEVTLEDAEAVVLADGAAYTVYVADQPIPTEDIATATITPGPEGRQATIYLTPLGSLSTASPVEEGAVVDYTTEPDVLTFSTVLLGPAGLHNQAVDGRGQLTLTSLDADLLCLEVDYVDQEKTVSGTVAAELHDAPF